MDLGKIEFSKEIGVSVRKLDDTMEELNLNYKSTPRDKRTSLISKEDQEKIKQYYWMVD